MELRPIENEHVEKISGWLSRRENYQWLHFGPGRQAVDAITLKMMMQRDLHLMRAFTVDGTNDPVGLVALSDIDRDFGTASVWYVLGDKKVGGRGYTTRAVRRLLDIAFDELDLTAVQAWTVETNEPSRRVLRRLGFRLGGRLRSCHRIDGIAYDRLVFDLLAEEHESAEKAMSPIRAESRSE